MSRKKTEEPQHELVSINEFAKRMDVRLSAVQYAISKGRIELSGEKGAKGSKLIDWTTQNKAWEANRQASARKYTKKNPDGTLKKYDKLEKHIGDSEVYDTGEMGIDPSFSRFDNIPDIDNIKAPKGSVAYYQAKKIAVDALRNLNKLRQETAQLITVPDAITLYGEVLTKLSDAVQTIPARVSSIIVANIRKSVREWKSPPENLENEIFRLITIQCKSILSEIAQKRDSASSMTEDFIDENIANKK